MYVVIWLMKDRNLKFHFMKQFLESIKPLSSVFAHSSLHCSLMSVLLCGRESENYVLNEWLKLWSCSKVVHAMFFSRFFSYKKSGITLGLMA